MIVQLKDGMSAQEISKGIKWDLVIIELFQQIKLKA